ncbi:uncharacterized protein LOC100829672 isoform X2 [Brachypodium distachyon]|uniref:uncharacterized protein LOC100829672 isoform X2 n=1 Tax=Brachypodium distachyon TaxID=15368 RepID=UPI000D0D6B98|nr:uncharacterized protein LOC100829672 isoform X2 [Brachypodium distachyon]|eukprot:XP_024311776.1 uncharacterized protein LOC100829672 isoform X2 [Brachypodium distachyon]
MSAPSPKRPRLSRPAPAPVARMTIADMVPEILRRLPANDPACLARASLICKPWRRLVSDRLRRYRAFHRTPPMLGFVVNIKRVARFVSTDSSFRPAAPDRAGTNVFDARHGRVLLHTFDTLQADKEIVVWDPVTDEQWRVPPLPVYTPSFNAAVLCAAPGCHHHGCHGGAFRVALVGSDERGFSFASTYSSETGAWSQRIGIEEPAFFDQRPSVLVGNTAYFIAGVKFKIVGYDVATQEISVVWPPAPHQRRSDGILMKAEDGALGFACVQDARLYLWSWKAAGPDGDMAWALSRVIDHKTMLRTRGLRTPSQVVGFAEGAGVIFVKTGNTVYSMDLKSGHVRKVYNWTLKNYDLTVVPYLSFYNPGALQETLRHHEPKQG